jgi:hypothetical protein
MYSIIFYITRLIMTICLLIIGYVISVPEKEHNQSNFFE